MRDKHYFSIFDSKDRYDDEIVKQVRSMLAECNGKKPEDISDELVDQSIWDDLDDERINLDVEVQGVIVAFASVGTWQGSRRGYQTYGSNVSSILSSGCDEMEWYADRYNVRGTMSHHDGSNYALYRVARNEDEAERITNRICCDPTYTEADFMRDTKSLRPYVAKVYGWKEYGRQAA